MKHFLDTGVILAASYVWNIEYRDFDPATITPKCHDAAKHLKTNPDNVTCTHVRQELKNLKERRRIAHEILILELINPSSEELPECWAALANGRTVESTERDRDWIRNAQNDLRPYPPIQVWRALHELRLLFERNIDDLLQRLYIYAIVEQQRTTRDAIRQRLRSIPGSPNPDDILIYANAVVYHNQEHNIIVLTIDHGFTSLADKTAERDLANQHLITSLPPITIL